MDILELTADLHIGMGQPGEQDFPRFAEMGYKTIVDLRTDMEDHLLSPAEEKETAEKEGMAYIRFPVSPANLDIETADRFRQMIDEAEAPVLVHCRAGARCGAFAMMHLAVARGTSAQEILRQATEMGFNCNSPFWLFAGRYIDQARRSE